MVSKEVRLASITLLVFLYFTKGSRKIQNPNAFCPGIELHNGDKCEFLKSYSNCVSGEFVYFVMAYHYCENSNFRILGFFQILMHLVWGYLLSGHITAEYFCPCLSKLSSLLKLSPTITKVTLLPLGNGALDVLLIFGGFFCNDTDIGDAGLGTALGGAMFVTSVVVGRIALVSVTNNIAVRIDRKWFVRDICFLLFTLVWLSVVLASGKIDVLGAVLFISIYVVYAAVVMRNEVQHSTNDDVPELDTVPQWTWTSDAAIYSMGSNYLLTLPIKLTVPIVEKRRWSKRFSFATALVSPMFLALYWVTIKNGGIITPLPLYIGGLFSITLGCLILRYTKVDRPPQKFFFLWIIGGFFMSLAWYYILAHELIALVVTLGVILRVNPSFLCLTVVAWGNSVGILKSKVGLATVSGRDVKFAISRCYVGAMFNVVVGLGVMMLLRAYTISPTPLILSRDRSLVLTIRYLMAGLLWTLFALLRKDMQLTKLLGIGLLGIYTVFLCVLRSSNV